ncbi:MAG: hypothetical protein AMS18_14890, partial [Gemmatimonas sp. SG8_17]
MGNSWDRWVWCAAAAVCLVAETPVVRAQAAVDASVLEGLEARAIGPAVMSGRITGIDAIAVDPLVIYVGAAGGGVWRSKDGGIEFEPI